MTDQDEERIEVKHSRSGCELDEARQKIEDLTRQLRYAEMLNDSSIDRVMALDTDLRITTWNTRNEQLSGISRKDITGAYFFKAFPDAEAHLPTVNAIRNALKGKSVFVPSDKASYDGGYYENHFLPLKDEAGQVTGVLNIKHDVAHRIKTEQELKSLNKSLVRKNKELKQKNEELLSFTHITAHDLKEPLRKIYTFIEMLISKDASKLSDSGKTYFKRIQAAAQRMGLLTDDVLSYAMLDTTRHEINTVDLDQVLHTVIHSLQIPIREQEAIMQIAPMPSIRGYHSLLIQLFQKLISNALKFHSQGARPTINISVQKMPGAEIKNTDANPDTRYAVISIEDNGIGFDPQFTEKMFMMFQRLHNVEEYPGTGMGLAICRKIAHMHHGFITADSTPGNGSVFKCYLPV